ncbi:MAG: hypothetical protein HY775_10015 [Acidobacteria bacterium]|nr:hypothetical protein [Acidobacteriota bacterium]
MMEGKMGTKNSDAVLAFDLGTGSVRACLVSLDGRVIARAQRTIRAHAPADAPAGREYHAEEFAAAVAGAARDALAAAPGARVAVLTADGIRPAMVMLDREGRAIHVGANVDLRAIEQSIRLWAGHRDLLHRVTGQLPPTLQWSSRIAWFRQSRPGELAAAATLTGLEGWVLSLFGVEPAGDLSGASGTGLFDLTAGRWSREILDLIEMDEARLAPVVPAGTPLGNARGDLAASLGIEGAAVCAGAGDTHAALAGAGAWEPGETAIVAGTTMAVARVLGRAAPRAPRLWSSRFVRAGCGMLEAQCWEAGLAWEWIAGVLGVGVGDLDRLAKTAAPAQVIAHIGTAPVDFSDPPLLRSGGLVFPLPPSMFGVGRDQIARGAIESAAWAAAEGLAWLDSEEPGAGPVRVTGGMTRSSLWLSCLAGALGQTVVAAQEDSASVGVAALAASGAGLVAGPQEVLTAARALDREIPVDEPLAAAMQAGRARWSEIVARLEEGAVRLSHLTGAS